MSTFKLNDLSLYNEQSIKVPSNNLLRSQEDWSNWMVKAEDVSTNTSINEIIQRQLPYPTNSMKDDQLIAEISSLFEIPLIEFDGQPVYFQPPIDQSNLLDQRGYWLEPEMIPLVAGKNELDILLAKLFCPEGNPSAKSADYQ